MNKALWVLQSLLALAFLGAGFTKVTNSPEALAAMGMTFATEVPPWMPALAGASEVLGAFGLVLPAATRLKPMLTPIAAAALTLVMVLALLTHVALGETNQLGGPLMLGALSAFVAWGRFKKAPIEARGGVARPSAA